MENELKTPSATHQGKLGTCTPKMNKLRSLLDNGDNTEKVLSGMEKMKITVIEFNDSAVQMLLPVEIKHKETIDWYEPKINTFEKIFTVDL